MSAAAYSLTKDLRTLKPGRRLCRCPALGEALGNWSYRVGFALRLAVKRGDGYWMRWWQAQRKFMRSGPGVRDELCVRCYEDGWEYGAEHWELTRGGYEPEWATRTARIIQTSV